MEDIPITKEEYIAMVKNINQLRKGKQSQLETICNQLSEAIGVPCGCKVAALIEDDGTLTGWCIVRLMPDGQITPINSERYGSIKDLLTLKDKFDKMMMDAIKKSQ